jgi:hypothetical protein
MYASSAGGTRPSESRGPVLLALALDLIEELRPVIVDTLVLALLNRRVIRATDFTPTDEGESPVEDAWEREAVACNSLNPGFRTRAGCERRCVYITPGRPLRRRSPLREPAERATTSPRGGRCRASTTQGFIHVRSRELLHDRNRETAAR